MNTRDVFLRQVRGEQLGELKVELSPDEYLQNLVLRPILKLQNELLIAVLNNYFIQNKIDFHSQSTEKRMELIENCIKKDVKLSSQLKGLIIAFFTLDEFVLYAQNQSNFNKRIISMLIERFKSQLQVIIASNN